MLQAAVAAVPVVLLQVVPGVLSAQRRERPELRAAVGVAVPAPI